MPGILPASPNGPNFSLPSLPNGGPSKHREDRDTVREIKENAKELVRTSSKGASAVALLNQVKTQFQLGRDCDRSGDLKDALSAYTKAASLVNHILEQSDSRKQKDVQKIIVEFMAGYGDELKKRTSAVEEKLRAIEKEERENKPVNGVEQNNGSDGSSGGGGLPSIAERMESLRISGLSISTNKRLSTQGHHNPPSPQTSSVPIPPSPVISSKPSQSSVPLTPTPLMSAPSISSLTSALHGPSASTSSGSPHSFVPPSTFGPPSPTSSPSSSPKLSNTLSEFNTQFPSIDEIEENATFTLPSVPTGRSTGSNHSASSKSSKLGGESSPISPTPHAALRNFIVPMERPSSTPITPTANNFTSRPASPSAAQPKPTIPIKPSNLSTSTSASTAATIGNGHHHPISSSPSYSNGILSAKSDIPKKNTATSKELKEYMKDHKVLLLDVRERAEFDKGHIRASGAAAVVCVEPSLLKEGVTGDTLEYAMSSSEAATFKNREMWDLVVVYDQDSTDVGDHQALLNVLVSAIYTNAFKKFLKRPPMVLEGGLEAWKADMGEHEVEGSSELGISFMSSGSASASASASASTSSGVNVGAAAQQIPIPPSSPSIISPSISRSPSKNPFANGGPLASSRSRNMSVSNGHSSGSPSGQPFEFWQPSVASSSGTATSGSGRSRAESSPHGPGSGRVDHRSNYSLDQRPMHSRTPADSGIPGVPGRFSPSDSSLTRRPALSRAPMSSTMAFSQQTINENVTSQPSSPLMNGASITYPSFAHRSTAGHSASSSVSSFTPTQYDITSPPQASVNPPLSRRRSDYIDQSQEAVSGLHRAPIEYPELPSQHTIRPPPAVASPVLDRQENRSRISQGYSSPRPSSPGKKLVAPTPPRIDSDWPVRYWPDVPIGMSGLKNMGNTCYMNAPIQCLSASPPFARFFTEGRWKTAVNHVNPLGSKGRLTSSFAQLVHAMWGNELPYLTPTDFRKTICTLNSQYIGSDQHDSQEFLSFLLDGIHEDLNRIIHRPQWNRTPEQEEELERLPPQIASEQEWRAWKERNDSIIVDYFQGQFRNQMKCLTCLKTSTTYNTFSILSVPIPHGRSGKVPLQRCLDAFFNTELMEKGDAWDCPRCKTKQSASKQLSLARLPPILVIHIKRFEANGRFSDKIDTFVDFPVKSLDLTTYMPPPLPVGVDRGQMQYSPDDPRTQLPPYKYDLYGVTNHVGNLSSGHYTAFVGSRGGWMYCDDSVIKPVDTKQVVSQKAYVLFYKRTKA
ncbi:ubiquitin-specific protease doa4 [Marasmius tenuissimus]|uniref:ubiquitinyl hydrolase 1 n=1 Tax=Marasmius tenuissimus TaxID=585030 RepID=A0ABR2ZH09_9AGAR